MRQKQLWVPCASKGTGGGFGTGCQREREKLAGDLPSTREGIKGQYTWGMAWGTESLASPHIHIIEPAGATTALNRGDSGCCALNHTISVHRWEKMGLILPRHHSLAGFLQDKIRAQLRTCCCYETGCTHKHRHGHWVFQSFPSC